jgi:uncharacterized protein with PIN domain
MKNIPCPFCDELIGEISRTYESVTINLSISHVQDDIFECPSCKKQFDAKLQLTMLDSVNVSLGENNASIRS